ncbi:MAG: hypothetical protein QM662_09825 [Gordonia sp. (in: high G+C Gram-positive bacteria)]
MVNPHSPTPRAGAAGDWSAMGDWLADAVTTMPPGAVLDIGPLGSDVSDDADVDVPCAQIQVLRDRTVLVRLSTTIMRAPGVAIYSVPRAALDRWNYEDRFADCTHGYLATRSAHTVAGICVGWFRDRQGMASPDELGCSYVTPTELREAG